MQGLALVDGLTALCTYGFEPFFSLHYEEIGNYTVRSSWLVTEEMKRLVGLRFPYCLMHYCLTNLADAFHLASILFTASLGLQKVIAVVCPIWSKTQMNERKSFIFCSTCILFTLVVNIPRLFVISFSSGKKADTCLVSEPHKAIQKYILAYFPILYAIILVCAVVAMLISTCYIIFTLCRRKRVRGHATVSRAEKKSCILIVCVMIVFFLAELPKIYVRSTLFSMYRSNLETQNVALHKTKTELSQLFAACLDDIPDLIISNESCISDFDDLPSHYKDDVTREVDSLTLFIEANVHRTMDRLYKGHLKQNYFDYLVDVLADERIRYANELKEYVKQTFVDNVKKTYCKATEKYFRKIKTDIFVSILKGCVYTIGDRDASYVILGSSPYSEPMNYIMNIVWGHFDITLEHLKLFTEILKLSMIIGCASNFLIYIVMSEKLREALKKTFKCREDQEERVDSIQMQTRR
ncbi:unnamed protein product [Mytilus coruscus]|uniref:G-protein coupled receptors family 1 profile domain-containing protein n=1 Tax=Mytilus coruscus TaxID=42192 RepID=A0A6J8CY44_MYTCO|nr:unnamed protein product [Mytilus coruscus]